MDDGPLDMRSWHPPDSAAAMLDGFLDRLEAGAVRVGVRQRLNAHRLLAAVILRGAGPEDFAYVRDMFTSLLATSDDEQTTIAAAFERDCAQILDPRRLRVHTVAPVLPVPVPAPAPGAPPKSPGWFSRLDPYRVAGIVIIISASTVVGFMSMKPVLGPGTATITEPTMPTIPGGDNNSGTGGQTPVEGAWTARQLLEDLARRNPPVLPTLREIWRTGWPPREATGGRQFTLAEAVRRTGIDPDRPLEIRLSTVQDQLILAFGEFGLFPVPSGEAAEPGGDIDTMLSQALRAYASDAQRRAQLIQLSTRPRVGRIAAIRGAAANIGSDTNPFFVAIRRALAEAPIDETIDRALAVALSNQTLPTGAFADATWQPSPPAAAHVPPPWLRWWLAAIPLVIFAGWLWNWRRDRAEHYRRLFARKRPLDHSLVLKAPGDIISTRTDKPYVKGVAHGLGARQTVGMTDIDAPRTVARMAAKGGFFDPVPGRITATPAYLFFIETRSPLDLEARRLDLLRQRLAAAGLDTKRYFYTQTPVALYERFGGPPLPLEEVAARDDDRRLVIMGEGAGFVDPATLKPASWTRGLEVWHERAMLSSKPVASWGAEERAIARDLELSLGRATIEGLAALPELLGLDSEADKPAMRAYGFASGQDLKPLPLPLRSDPYRWLAPAPPETERDDWWPVLEYRLSLYLDQAGLDWLKALAVYPALTWELTLYLGRGLKDAGGIELYAEPRLAALTRLPWLREGRMPEWLRDAMIATLDPQLRKATVALIAGIVAPVKGADRTVEVLREQQRPWIGDLGQTPAEDRLFLDTFAEGAESAAIDLPEEMAGRLTPVRLELFRHALKVFAAALIFAAAAFWLTPDPADGILRSGGYLPVAALFLAAALGWSILNGWRGRIARALTAAIERLRPRAQPKLLEPPSEAPTTSLVDAEAPFIYVSYINEDRERAERLAADLRREGANLWLPHEHVTPASPEIYPSDRAAGILSILTSASRSAGFIINYHAGTDVGRSKPMTIVMLEPVEIEDTRLRSAVLDMTGSAYGGNIEYLARKLLSQTRAAESQAGQKQVAT